MPTGTTPILAEGTASIELAGRAEKGTAEKPEVLEPRVHGEAGRRHEPCEVPPQSEAGCECRKRASESPMCCRERESANLMRGCKRAQMRAKVCGQQTQGIAALQPSRHKLEVPS